MAIAVQSSSRAFRVTPLARLMPLLPLAWLVACATEQHAEQPTPGPVYLERVCLEQASSAEVRVESISAGSLQTCALLSDCGALCWGLNDVYQLATDTAPAFVSPIRVARTLALDQISLALDHSCALSRDGAVWCWGDSSDWQLGKPVAELPYTAAPVRVGALPGRAMAVAAAGVSSCALLEDGSAYCWGDWQHRTDYRASRRSPSRISGVEGAIAVAHGGGYFGALTSDGGVVCWGDNSVGELGDGNVGVDASRNDARPVVGLPDRAVGLVLGCAVGCAILESSEVACWGEGEEGCLGNGSLDTQPTPVMVAALQPDVTRTAATPTLRGVVALDVDTHACAALTDGSLACWGDDVFLPEWASPGNQTIPAPVLVDGIGGVVDVAVGFWYTCALTDDQEIYCWGNNEAGNLGLGPGADYWVHTPTRVDWRAALE